MRASTIVLVLGAILFVIPIPGLFILGGLVMLAGGAARWFGH